MKYFVVSDVHGFYTQMKKALDEQGFNPEDENHKLIICGDLMDRGKEAVKMQEYIKELLNKDKVVLIKGNHEDLMQDLLKDIDKYSLQGIQFTHHWSNGTYDTAMQLAGNGVKTISELTNAVNESVFVKDLIPAMKDYFETEHYVFVHGWIPCHTFRLGNYGNNSAAYSYDENWRNASPAEWEEARWINGMQASSHNVIVPDKTIVCGHWHASWGHSFFEGDGSQWGEDANFKPFEAEGIIAIDGCTARSKFVNCIVVED